MNESLIDAIFLTLVEQEKIPDTAAEKMVDFSNACEEAGITPEQASTVEDWVLSLAYDTMQDGFRIGFAQGLNLLSEAKATVS